MRSNKKSRITATKGGRTADTANYARWAELPHELLATIATCTCPPPDPVPATGLGSARNTNASLSCASRRHAQLSNCPTTQSTQQTGHGGPRTSANTPMDNAGGTRITCTSSPSGAFQPEYMSATARAMRCVCQSWCEVLSEGVVTVNVQQPQPLSLWPTHFPSLTSLDLSPCTDVHVRQTGPASSAARANQPKTGRGTHERYHNQNRTARSATANYQLRCVVTTNYPVRSLANLTSLRTLSCQNSSSHMEFAGSCSALKNLHVSAENPLCSGSASSRDYPLFALTHRPIHGCHGRSGYSFHRTTILGCPESGSGSSSTRHSGRRSGLDLTLGRLSQLRHVSLFGVDASAGRLGCALMGLSALTRLQLQACRLPTFFGQQSRGRSPARSFCVQLVANLGSKLRALSLQGCGLWQLPEEVLAGLTGLRLLDLSANNLKILPRSITSLTALEHLDVQCNLLRILPDGLPALSRLVDLDLSSNMLPRLPADLKGLTSLTLLSLKDLGNLNAAATLPLLAPLTNLVALDLSGMDLSFDPFDVIDLVDAFVDAEEDVGAAFGPFMGGVAAIPAFGVFVPAPPAPPPAPAVAGGGGVGGGLVPPVLHQTALSDLLAALAPAGRLCELVLNGCGLDALPARVSELMALCHLSVADNDLTEFPTLLSSLTNLVVLRLDRLCLEKPLQPGFFNLTGLRELDMQNNYMPYMSPDISKLTNLQVLNLQNALLNLDNPTSEPFPWPSIYSLTRLSAIAITGEPLHRLMMPPGVSALIGLQVVVLSDVQLPSNVFTELCRSATHLRCLSLKRCGIAKVPNHITRLDRLREVLLDSNKLSRLPSGVLSKLVHLTDLGLSDNKDLRSLPADITRVSGLQYISWSVNESTRLPRELLMWLSWIPELALQGGLDVAALAKTHGVTWPKGTAVQPSYGVQEMGNLW